MFVYTIWDIIGIAIIGIIIIIAFIIAFVKTIIEIIKPIGKKNCYECKHYDLCDVCSAGDGCWYRCKKHDRKDDCVSHNVKTHYEKCKDFEKEGEIKNEKN